jgi:hypothetical protein
LPRQLFVSSAEAVRCSRDYTTELIVPYTMLVTAISGVLPLPQKSFFVDILWIRPIFA